MSVLSTQKIGSIEVVGLRVVFGQVQAVRGVDLHVNAGEVHVLLGSNGAGKSTLVRVVTTLQRPSAGCVRVSGLDVVAQRAEVRRRIAVASQGASLDEALTGAENLQIIGGLTGLSRRRTQSRAIELLAQVGLREAGGRPVKTYSGGMRRRLDLAASLIADPEVLVVDEPTTGLDPAAKRMIWGLIRDRAAHGCAVLLTTQDLTEAQELATFITVLHAGSVLASGTSAQLRSSIGTLTLRLTTDRGTSSRAVDNLIDGLNEAALAATTAVKQVEGGARPDVAGDRANEAFCGAVLRGVSIEPPDLTDIYLALTQESR